MKFTKKIIPAVLLLALLLMATVSCTSEPCTVTYVYGNGTADKTVNALSYMPQTAPADPARENYIFGGWFKDTEYTKPFDFDTSLTGDVTLYAKWLPNYEKLSTAATSKAAPSCVSIKAIHYERAGLKLEAGEAAMGSGVIYQSLGDYYYVLSNNHVVAQPEGVAATEYFIYDVYGTEYSAEVLYASAEYDLSLMRFKASEKISLPLMHFAKASAALDDTVIAIGSPEGRRNSITFGTVKNLKSVAMKDDATGESAVEFAVIWHTAYTTHGSSGGALINADMELVGINFATGSSESGKFSYGFTIPIERVSEFLVLAGNNM